MPKTRTTRSQRVGQSGATLVEFALIAVLLFTIVGLVAEGGFLFSTWLAVTNGASEGARYGAPCINRTVESCTDADVEAVVRDRTRGFLDQTPGRFDVYVTHDASEVTVIVSATVSSVGPILGDIPVAGKSVMRSEY